MTLLECLPQAWTASLDSIFNQPPPAPTSHNAAIELLLSHTKWLLPHTPPQQQPQQDQQHQHGAIQSSPGPLSLSSSTFTVRAATNFLMQPSQTARMEAWQQCTESAITLAAPTQPQEETRHTALAITKVLRTRVRQVWRLSWENNRKEVWWRLLQHGVVGAGGHGWPMKRETACPCGWQHSAASPRAAQALQLREHVFWNCTGASAIRRAIQHNLPGSVQLLPRHVWLLEQP
jgi:hypothetical protein